MAREPRTVDVTLVSEWESAEVRQFQDYLAGEEPLEIRVNGAALVVTMRTPGKDDLELAAGFLFTEGLIKEAGQIDYLGYEQDCKPTERGNVVNVRLRGEVDLDPAMLQRNFPATSSCGVCGKASIDAVRQRSIRRPNPDFRLAPEVLCALPDRLRAAQNLFGRTGGLHAAGLFDAYGNLLVLREDVGRHNAVDKTVGWALLEGRLPLSDCVLLVSGRGGFEIIQKAIVAGIPLLASVSAPSSLAVRLARELGLTLVGFLRGRRFIAYAGGERLGLKYEALPSK